MNILQIPTNALDTLQKVSTSIEALATSMSAFELATKGGWIMIVLIILLALSI